MKKKLAERIRKARLLLGLSQQNVADELNLTIAAYSNIERGVTEITVVRLYQIAEILQTTAESFLSDVEQESYNHLKMSDQLALLDEKVNGLQHQFDVLRYDVDMLKLQQR